MEQSDIEAKQNYLRSEILDKGYDGEEFFKYLVSLRGDDGSKLELWTMNELTNVVNDFHNSHQSANVNMYPPLGVQDQGNYQDTPQQYPDLQDQYQNNVPGPQPSTPSDSQTQPPPIQPMPTIQPSQPSLPPQQNSGNVIEFQCLGNEDSPLASSECLTVKLSFPEKTPEHSGFVGLFSKKTYISYLIETSPIGLRARRRYTDFEWLRNTFSSIYPGIYIPPIPRKQLYDNASDVKIEKRMRALEKFLNAVVIDPLLKTSPILYDFLSIEKDADYSKKKKTYALNAPVNLLQFHTRTGRIILDQSLVKDKKLFEDIKKNIEDNQTELEKLSKAYKALFTEMNAVSTRMAEIAEIYSRMYTQSVKMGENENLIKSYQMMKKLMSDWGYSELKQAKNIEIEVREHFKYVGFEYNSLKELYDRYDYSKNLYLKSREKLLGKKQELFKRGDVSKWELNPQDKFDFNNQSLAISKMLPKETASVENLKYVFMYHANSLNSEFNRIREVIGFQNKEKFVQFYNKNSKVLDELNLAWQIFRGN